MDTIDFHGAFVCDQVVINQAITSDGRQLLLLRSGVNEKDWAWNEKGE